jgi:hypothetical protein
MLTDRRHRIVSHWPIVCETEAGAKVAISAEITKVQVAFKPLFNAKEMATDGSQFDRLLREGDRFPLGRLELEIIDDRPGHTPACVTCRRETRQLKTPGFSGAGLMSVGQSAAAQFAEELSATRGIDLRPTLVNSRAIVTP